MLSRLIVTLSVVPFLVLTPVLEIGATHVLNPAWPAHARLHEVWQLATNCGIAILILFLAWVRREERLAAIVGLPVTGGFFVALSLAPLYGGSMRHADGTELAFLGVNLGTLIMGFSMLGLSFVIFGSRGPARDSGVAQAKLEVETKS